MDEQDEALLRWLMADAEEAQPDDADRALLDSLRADRRSDPTRTEDDADLLRFLRDSPAAAPAAVDAESGLRSLGYNYRQRDAILRPTQAPKPMSARNRRRQRDRLRWHLNQRVDWSSTEHEPDFLVGAWMELCGTDLDLALRWWDAGVDPACPDIVDQLVAVGFGPRDLTRRIGRRSVLEELRRGSTVQWCLMALGWQRHRHR